MSSQLKGADMEMKNSAINMVVTHINVPYGSIVTREHLVRVLTTGTLSSLPDGESAKSILHWLL